MRPRLSTQPWLPVAPRRADLALRGRRTRGRHLHCACFPTAAVVPPDCASSHRRLLRRRCFLAEDRLDADLLPARVAEDVVLAGVVVEVAEHAARAGRLGLVVDVAALT